MDCLLCGSPPPLIEGVCHPCFAKRIELASLPSVLQVTVCPRCDGILQGTRWLDFEDFEAGLTQSLELAANLHPQATEVELKGSLTPQDPYSRRAALEVTGNVEGVPLTASFECRLELKRQVCTPCSRQAGGYYEAILQLRGLDRLEADRLAEYDERVKALATEALSADRNLFIAKRERVKGGYDYYLSSLGHARQLARGLVREYGGTTGESPKLVGRKEGRNLYRVSLVVRLPTFAKGDFVLHEGRPARIKRIEGSRVILAPLAFESPVEMALPLDIAGKAGRLGGPELAIKIQIVSVTGREAVVLDPETYQPRDIVLPEAWAEGDELLVVCHEGRLYPMLTK